MDKSITERTGQSSKLEFQKEKIYNRVLPYHKELFDEADHELEIIKTNLSLCVSKCEIRPGCDIWTRRLRKYITYFGQRFSKEDHLAFIHLYYQLLLIPYLEPYLFGEFCRTLSNLLKKKDLISPQELVLEWRPLYNLCKSIMFSSRVDLGMYGYGSSLEEDFILVIHAARVYFPATATQEMLSELRPQWCPLDNTTLDTVIRLMTYFIPISRTPSFAKNGYNLWFKDIMNLWEVCISSSTWEGNLMDLMSFLAESNVGHIDWEPYIPVMFNRFISCFQLPVSYKSVTTAERFHWDVSAIACWIVCTLGGGSKAQKYLENLMASLESYFNPVNSGRWTSTLSKLLQGLTYHFIKRLNFERYKKLTWQEPVPEEKKLNEEDITNFVKSLKFVTLQAMFSEAGEVKLSLQFLATLRPQLIVPDMIEYFYSTVETSTNPSKYKVVLLCLTVVLRPALENQLSVKEGSAHVIPLLWAVMPGIDPNDWEKTTSSLQFVDTVVSMVSLVDCSKAAEVHTNLTEDEKSLCLQTANFENLILEFYDRCFHLISSSSSLESTRLEQAADKQSKFENLAQELLLSTCITVARQISKPIFQAALSKLLSFIKCNILETKVAGRLMAGIVQSFVQANAVETLKLLVPFLAKHVLVTSSFDDFSVTVAPSSEFLFYLQLTSKIVNCPGTFLLPYANELNDVLKKSLQISSREGFTMASKLLHDLIKNLLLSVPFEYCSVPHSIDLPINEIVPFREWGKSGDINNLNVAFYEPGDKEIQFVISLVEAHLPPQMSMIEDLVNSKSPKIDEKLEHCLEIITSLLECRSLLPDWDDEVLPLMETGVNYARNFNTKKPVRKCEAGSVLLHLRKALLDLLEKLQAILLTLKEYDTKSLIVLTKIWSLMLTNNTFNKHEHDVRFKCYRNLKKSLENKLIGEKKHLRILLLTRVQIQNEILLDRDFPFFTATHKRIMINLLTLSTSNYSDVRREARSKLNLALERFPYSYKVLIPPLCEYLSKDAQEEHGTFEGALRILIGPTSHPILVQHDWNTLHSIWPVLIRARPEKESILTLLDVVEEIVEDDLGTITIGLEISESCIEKALKLNKKIGNKLSNEERKEIQNIFFQKNEKQYLSLLNCLVSIIQNETLHCRFQCLAVNFLMALVHPVVRYSSEVVKCFLEFLINDSLELRKYAILGVIMVLKQQKLIHEKLMIDPWEFIGERKETSVLMPGDRFDNQWVKYKEDKLPRSKEDWERMYFLHREYYGYYSWPDTIMVYAPAHHQPPLKPLSLLSQEEKEIKAFFSDESKVNKLLSFLTLEEKKGEDKFLEDRYLLFKGLFRNCGHEQLKIFVPHLQKFVKSPQESCQRCAAEMIAGAIRGAKHWPFEMLNDGWSSLIPLIKDALQHMNEETVNDWKTCFALASENRDPRWNYRLFQVFLEDQGQHNSSFTEAKRILCFETALSFHLWSLSEIKKKWLETLKTKVSHPFQNVRTHVGEALCRIFEADFTIPNGSPPNAPRISAFVKHVLPSISRLYNTSLNDVEGQALESTKKTETTRPKNAEMESTNASNASVVEIRLLKTICVWVSAMMDRSVFGVSSEFYNLFPTLCVMENYKSDSELKQLCTNTLGKIAHATHLSCHLSPALAAIKKASQCSSWQGRVTCTEFLQVFVFYNMPIILENPKWSDEVRTLVMELLEDKCLEVREKSAELLCGLLHTGFIEDKIKLLDAFKDRISKLKSTRSQNMDQAAIKSRHSALLGLCAFIDAHPYDVPDFIPHLFVILQKHLSDPHPIPVTIRKTICNFQRTHHDNWSQFKHKFNEDQLSILEDLTTGPTYYA